MKIFPRQLFIAALCIAMAAGAAGAQQPAPPAAAPPTWPDLSGTWKGTWGGAPTTLVIFKRSEGAFVSQALGGMYSFAQQVVGQGDSDVVGTLTTDGRAGPISVSAAGRMGTFNNRLTLVLNAQPGFGIRDYQELVFTTVTPEQLSGTGTSTMQWGPAGEISLKRQAR
jgi:hypothetical protein